MADNDYDILNHWADAPQHDDNILRDRLGNPVHSGSGKVVHTRTPEEIKADEKSVLGASFPKAAAPEPQKPAEQKVEQTAKEPEVKTEPRDPKMSDAEWTQYLNTKEIQGLLIEQGGADLSYTGRDGKLHEGIDGDAGHKTRAAIAKALGMEGEYDGEITDKLIDTVREKLEAQNPNVKATAIDMDDTLAGTPLPEEDGGHKNDIDPSGLKYASMETTEAGIAQPALSALVKEGQPLDETLDSIRKEAGVLAATTSDPDLLKANIEHAVHEAYKQNADDRHLSGRNARANNMRADRVAGEMSEEIITAAQAAESPEALAKNDEGPHRRTHHRGTRYSREMKPLGSEVAAGEKDGKLTAVHQDTIAQGGVNGDGKPGIPDNSSQRSFQQRMDEITRINDQAAVKNAEQRQAGTPSTPNMN